MNPQRLRELLNAYVDQALTEDERVELEQALVVSEETRRSFWEFARQHAQTRELMLEADAAEKARSKQISGSLRLRFKPLLMTVAASVLVVASVGTFFLFFDSGPYDSVLAGELRAMRSGRPIILRAGERIRHGEAVATASQASCLLRDGSFIKLDRGSRVLFQNTQANERAHLRLQEGRIFLRLTSARGRFVVSGDAGGQVEALGTIFGVSEQKEGLVVSVFKGRVAVGSPAGKVEVGGGQSAEAPVEGMPVLTEVDPNSALLWAREVTEFRRRALGEVLDWIEANSSYSFDVPPVIRSEMVTITISEDPMLAVIRSFCAACGLTCEIAGTRAVIRKGEGL